MSAWTVIEHREVPSGGVTDITLSSIPQTYTDLVIKFSGRSDNANIADAICVSFNGTTSGYSSRRLAGDGVDDFTDTLSQTQGGVNSFFAGGLAGNNATANTFSNLTIYIPNYTSSVAKSISADSTIENNATGTDMGIHAGLWTGTDPITSINLVRYRTGATILQYSSVTLYGVLKGSSGGVTVS